MRRRAEARAARWGVRVDPRPYGTHSELAGACDVVLFCYSLSMIPPYEDVIERARRDLAPAGRIGVVDFLDALEPLPARTLASSHVHLGPERLAALRKAFPAHSLEVRSAGLWRYILFVGRTCG